MGGRTAVATLDSANRLAGLTVNGVTQGYGYDANGNLTSRGAQGFAFDIGNRLTSAPGKASYAYDGHGRRTWVAYADGSWKLQVYGSSGKLLYTNHSSQGHTRHVYLGSRLIAEDNTLTGTSYSHTDALGSPVARTNSAGQVLGRTRYEPYGATAAGTNPTGIGFTGHVNDADTGLVYMQQRYYEPIAGRFLSVDPVVTDGKDGSFFNRYVYANNNPYRFKDPDGRSPWGVLAGMAVEVGYQVLVQGRAMNQLDYTDIVVAGAIGAILPGAGSATLHGAQALQKLKQAMEALDKLENQATNTKNRAAKIAAAMARNNAKAAKAVGDAAADASKAAAGVALKNEVQEEVNKEQARPERTSDTKHDPQPQAPKLPKENSP